MGVRVASRSPSVVEESASLRPPAGPSSVRPVLDATTQLFEVGGASITSEALRLDRHWRNARTISVHNPLIYKLRVIGDHVLNDSDLPYAWSAGRR